MPKRPAGTTVRLTRMAMNPDSVQAHGLVFKLQYGFASRDRPSLQIFPNTEEAEAGEWRIYGAPDTDGLVASIAFSGLNDEREVALAGARWRVTFVAMATREIDYPRGGKAMEPVYEFTVEPLRTAR